MARTDAHYFLRLGDIEGASKVKAHEGEIEVLSFGWGASQEVVQSGGGGMGAGKVDIDELAFVAESSIASPAIFLACAQGRHLPDAELKSYRVTKNGKEELFLTIRMKDLLVTSYSTFAAGGDLPDDEVSLVFGQIEVELRSGSKVTSASWDVAANAPV